MAVKLLLVNRLLAEKRDESLAYIAKAFTPLALPVAAAFDYSPVLANPTLQSIAKLLAHPLHGDQGEKQRIIHNIQLGAASSQKVIDNLRESTLLITTSSRDELLVTLSSLYHIPAYREKIAGIVIPGHAPVSTITQKIIDDSGIPHIRIEQTTAEVFSALNGHVSKIAAEDSEKISLITSQAEQVIDFAAIETMHDCSQLMLGHLAVCNRHTRFRHKILQVRIHGANSLDTVMHEKDLATALQLTQDGLTRQLGRIGSHVGNNWQALLGRSVDG